MATSSEQVIQIGNYGAIFELKPPHTLESVKADAVNVKRHGLCRLKHAYRVIGTPYVPEHDIVTATLSLLASSDGNRLVRCRRCKHVAERRG
jgi:hypothetical protein